MSSGIEILIKTPSRTDNFKVKIQASGTVAQAKQVIARSCDTPPERQRLIFAGRVLKDHQVISDCKIVDGVTVHMVPMPNANAAQQPVSASSPSPNQTPTPTPPPQQQQYQQQSPFNLGGLFGNQGNFMEQMQQNILNNPQMMEQIMQNPLVQQLNQRLMNDPELLRSLVENNPQMRQIMESNPEVAHILRDPAMLRQAMELSQNPNLMREMMRNTDRTMANIENIPGGFNLLRQQYENVVEPMQQATQMPDRTRETGNASEESPSATPNTAPLPNPWDRNSNFAGAGAPQGAGNTNTNVNPMANLFNMFGQGQTGAGGATGTGAGTANANPMAGLFNMDPAQMNNMMQMAAQMFGGGGGGDGQAAASNLFSMNQLFGGSPSTGQTAAAGSQQPQMSPEARYAVQLQQLNDMGFNDQEANIRCLVATSGNVNAAIERLLGGL